MKFEVILYSLETFEYKIETLSWQTGSFFTNFGGYQIGNDTIYKVSVLFKQELSWKGMPSIIASTSL